MSGFLLPAQVPGGATGWALRQYLGPVSLTSAPAAGGTCRVDFDQLDGDVMWLIDRAVISCDSGAVTSLRLYSGEPALSRLLSGTPVGNFDEAEYPTGLYIEPTRWLCAVWSGATDGARGTINLQLRELERAG